ncbi:MULTISPECIES: MATE family efflux transporter [unclassified Pseudomonas]|uniref:MATE family efflux transporter n=1 Tax=unclassified Pseudomonas TaxID=196821 RepID=UPI00069E4F2F|nr:MULTISPECIES: MATE family efflux transporter [unclassified Pseudomonas]WPN45642.1 MATE family efflux transporter [Pseudomonas sp. P8_241]
MNPATQNTVAIDTPRTTPVRQELKGLLSLALPIMIAQLATTAMGFVDAVMAGRVSPRDLASVALGNSIWIPVYLLMSGVLLATTPKVAQRFGAGQFDEIGPLVRQAMWLALYVGLIGSGLLLAAEPILHWMKVDPQLIEPSMGYLDGIAFGLPGMAFYYVLRCYSDGMGRTRPSMVIGLCGLLLNIPLNYTLIYGHFGAPALGGVGCGWASGIVMWFMALSMAAWTFWAPFYARTRVLVRFDRPKWSVIKRLVSIGLPIGIAVFAESSIFAVIALLIGSLGSTVVAGHQIALNISSLLFMIPYSLGMAVTVRVGQALGAGNPYQARFAAKVGLGAALVFAAFSATLILCLREPIASIYTPDKNVIQIASMLIVYAALYQFSDAIQVICAGALRGYQDTRVTMILTLFAYWGIGLPVGYVLGLTDWFGPASGPNGLWEGLIAGLSCAALMLSIRLTRSARKRIRLSQHSA